MTRIIAFAGVVAGLALVLTSFGCEISQRLNGQYEGFRDVKVNPGTDPIVARQLSLVRLEAKPDGTAYLSDQGMAVEGQIGYGSKSATFTPTKVAGVSVAVQRPEVVSRYTIELIPRKDGTWIYDGTVVLSPKGRSSAGG